MVDFATHFTIHAKNRLSKTVHFTWKTLSLKVVHLPIACHSERSLRYFRLGRISDFFSIHRSSSHTLLAAEKKFRVAQYAVRKLVLWEKLKYERFKNTGSCPKL